MGIFQQKPEEQKKDWAGLPSEPWEPGSEAEALGEEPAVDLFAVSLEETVSLTLPVTASVTPPEPEASDSPSGQG